MVVEGLVFLCWCVFLGRATTIVVSLNLAQAFSQLEFCAKPSHSSSLRPRSKAFTVKDNLLVIFSKV